MAKHSGASNCSHGRIIFWNKSSSLLTGDVFISFYRLQLKGRRIFINIALVPPPTSADWHSRKWLPWLQSSQMSPCWWDQILIFLRNFLFLYFFYRVGFLRQLFLLRLFSSVWTGHSSFESLLYSAYQSLPLAWVGPSIIKKEEEPPEAGIHLLQTPARLSSNCPRIDSTRPRVINLESR